MQKAQIVRRQQLILCIHWGGATGGQEHWLICWEWLKSDRTCTQVSVLAAFPLTMAKEG